MRQSSTPGTKFLRDVLLARVFLRRVFLARVFLRSRLLGGGLRSRRRLPFPGAAFLTGRFLAGAPWLSLLATLILLLAPAHDAEAARCRTVPTCIAQLQFGESRNDREYAAIILGERGERSALGALTKAIKEDKGEFVRVKAAQALGRLGSPKGLPPVI